MSPLSSLVPKLASVTNLLADTYAPEKPRSRWYCDDPECNGKPHGEWDYNHCRKNQRPPDGDWYIWLLLSGRGFGKQISLDTPIPTPTGWTTMGDIVPGQMVFDENGSPCRVTRVFNIETPEKAWRLHFSDGTTIDACGDHEWVTWDHAARKAYLRSPYENTSQMPSDWPKWRVKVLRGYGNRLDRATIEDALILQDQGLSVRKIATKLGRCRQALAPHLKAGRYIEVPRPVVSEGAGPRVRTTNDLAASLTHSKRGDLNHCIPVTGALNLPRRDLPVDPYVLGYWLGDGSKSCGEIAVAPADQANVFGQLAAYAPHPTSRECVVGTYGLMMDLRKAGVLNNKHVPSAYLRASAQQRLAILQGLMDSDGHATPSSVEFCNTNKALIDGVVELARSLGQKPHVAESRAMLNGKDCGPKWRVTWKPTIDVFRLERKRNAVKMGGPQGFRNLHRMITAIEPIEPVPMRCISVDSPNRMYLAGEGMIPTHNSRCAAEWIVDQVSDHPRTEWGVIGPTSESVRKCAEDLQAGITNIAPEGLITKYNRTLGDIFLSNGAIIHLISADKPDRLRGFNLAGAWCDEVSSWRYPDAWDLGLLPAIRDARVPPRIVVTTTPKPVELVRRLANRDDPRNTKTRITYGSTFDNADNLPQQALDELRARYDGTRKGRQELYGELLLDVDGALVDQDMIDDTRLREMPPNIRTVRTVVAVDPATTSGERSDETGIIVCSRGADGRGYILADLSCRDSPDGWARKVVGAYERFHADRVVLEKNQGGEAWETIIRSIHPNISFKAVNSGRKGKYTRAEPVAALYEQGKISHVGIFEELEDQLTTWVPGETGSKSPDHLDALVYGIIELGLVGLKSTHLREAMEEAHPPCMVCGMPAPKGTPKCPKCGTALDGDGVPAAPTQPPQWHPHHYGPSPIQPDPTTRAVMDMLREVLPQQKFGPGRFGR